MKQILFILLSLKTLASIAQQSEIRGIISIHNSEYETGKRQYVPNAQVEDDFAKATPQTTDANGNFKLVFVRIPEKTSVQLIVKKENLQVVNIDGLSAVTGQRDLVRLSMAKPDKIAEYRRQIYQVGKTEAEKNLAAQLKKKGEQIETLQKDAVKNKAAIEKLQKERAELQAFTSKIEEQAQDLARRYAPINLDDAAPLYRESFRLFQQGDLAQALQILRGAGLINQANNIFAERKNIKNIRNEAKQRDSIQEQRTKDLMQVLGLKADLHEAKFEWDSVLFCLELKLNLDSTNVDNLWTFAGFLTNQQEHLRSIKLYQKILNLAITPSEKCMALNTMAGIHNFLRNDAEASECIKEALKISEPLAAKNPDLYDKDLAMNLETLGEIYQSRTKFKEAEESFIKSLKIYKNLAEKEPETYLSYVGNGLGQLGFFYVITGRLQDAEIVLAELPELFARLHAINPNEITFKFNSLLSDTTLNSDQKYNNFFSIIFELVHRNPDAYLPWLGYFHSTMSNVYIGNKQLEDALQNVSEAVDIYRKLAKEKPESFLPQLAISLTKLGNYQSTLYNVSESHKAFREADSLYRELSFQKPDVYLSSLAYTQFCLGHSFQAIYEIDNAEKAFLEALDIYKKLADENPIAYSLFLANTYSDLAAFYQNKFENGKSELLLIKALDLYKELEQKQGLNPKFPKARTLNTWGINYQRKGDNKAAENAYRESLTLHQQVEDENPGSNLLNLAICKSNLGYVYIFEQKKEEAEKHLTEALELYKQLEKKNGDRFAFNKAFTLNALGNFYAQNNQLERGLPYLEESVKINEKLYQAGPSAGYSYSLANIYNELAVLYQSNSENEKAELLLIKALDLYKELEQKQGLNLKFPKALTLNTWGINYQRKGDNKAAENAYRESLTLHQQVEDENPGSNLLNLAICKSNLGYINGIEQKKEEAEKHLTEALELHKQLEKKNGDRFAFNKAFTLNALGNFYAQNNQLERGLPYLEESLKINEKLYQAGNTSLRNQLASEFGNLSWWELFAKQFDKAEGYGLRCFSLDNTQLWVWTNIGHARFLTGRLEDAKNAWLHLKGIKDNAGKDFKEILQEDWTAIEKAGIVQIGTFESAKNWLAKTWLP